MKSVQLLRPVGADHLGYGTFGRNLLMGLEDLGVEVWDTDPDEGWERPYGGVQVPLNVILASQPPHLRGKFWGQDVTLYTMWETENIPPLFSSQIHCYERVFLPNQQNVDLFSEYNDNCHKVPLGYDSQVWRWIERKQPEDEFRFLFCGAGALEKTRKGSDIAIQAFERAFPDWKNMVPQPKLVIKCVRHPPLTPDFCDAFTGEWPIDELVSLYGWCHAMVLPSRGEGWGYHPQQAVATGMPAIVSDIPGHLEFSHLPGFFHIPVGKSKAGMFLQGDGGTWWEPDIEWCAAHMRHVYDNYADSLEAAAHGANLMRHSYDYLAMARNVLRLVPDLGYGRADEWNDYVQLEYPLRVTKWVEPCTIAGDEYEFFPGQDYWVSSCVRQVLENAGVSEFIGGAGRLPKSLV